MHIRQLATALPNLVSPSSDKPTAALSIPMRGLRPANLEGRIFGDQCVPSAVFLLSLSYFPLFPIPASHQEEEEEDVRDKEILLRDL